MTIEGVATDADGNRIQNAKVAVFLSDQSAGATGTVKWAETDSNGNFVIENHPDATGNTQSWHVAGEYTDGASNEFNAFSKPYVSASVNPVIPDSVVNRYNAGEESETDTQTIDPWNDLIGSMDLAAVGDASLNAGSVNGNDAVDLDGEGDGYDYATNLTETVNEPVSIIWAVNVRSLPRISMLWRDETGGGNQVYLDNRPGNNYYNLRIDGVDGTGGTLSTGDHIITLTVSSGNGALLRVDGADTTTVSASNVASGLAILDGGSQGAFYYDYTTTGRSVDGLAVETAIHDVELTGSDLTNEESRVESEAGMSVL